MLVKLKQMSTGQWVNALLLRAKPHDAPLKKDGWHFNWRQLFKVEGATFFKITLEESPNQIEGIVMLSIYFGEMVFMNNLEIAPRNIGSMKRYDHVAGCLIAHACKFSMEEGKGNYQGYLTFETKTELRDLYIQKYGAVPTMGRKMFIPYEQGFQLIDHYLAHSYI